MLTYIGNFKNNFKINKLMSDEDLKLFYDSLIKKDFINFNMSKVGQGFYPKEIRDTLLKNIVENYPLDSKIYILNDLSLHLYNDITNLGYKNISLIFGGFKKEGDKISHIENDNSTFIIKSLINSNFKEFKNNSTATILSVKEFLNMNNNIINDKSNLVIANPPYEIGNTVITEVMKHCNEAVVLMPLKQYKKQDSKLWEKVQQLEVINSSWFEDACMSDNLNIAYLSNFQNGPYKKYDDLTFLSLNDNYKLFYKYNLDNKDKYIKGYHKKYGIKVLKELGVEPNLWFAYTERTSQDGVHTTSDCHDYRWNIEKINYIPVSDAGQAFLLFAKFNSEVEHKNFCHWWYKSKDLAHKAIKGLNRSSGTCEEVFPQIDWSKTDVEYTDEYVLSQMGLKWNENRDGVEKL